MNYSIIFSLHWIEIYQNARCSVSYKIELMQTILFFELQRDLNRELLLFLEMVFKMHYVTLISKLFLNEDNVYLQKLSIVFLGRCKII